MRILRFFIYIFGIAAFLAMTIGYLGSLHPAFDSIGHFRIHIALATLLSGFMIALARGFPGGIALITSAALVLWTTIMPLSGQEKAVIDAGNGPVYRLLQSNLRFSNLTPDAFLHLVGEVKPDVITVQEVSRIWPSKFNQIKYLYPYQLICPGSEVMGPVAIISRRPFVAGDSGKCLQGSILAIQSIDFGGQTVTFASIHLRWPWPGRQPRQINDMLPSLAPLKVLDHSVFISGDLNAATWSHTAKLISQTTGTEALHYSGGSWAPLELPSQWTPFIGLPLDNIFHNDKVKIRSIVRQQSMGSDHLPLLIEFTFSSTKTDSEPDQAAS